MKKTWIVLLLVISALPADACITCNAGVQAGIFNEHFLSYLLLLPLPVVITMLIAIRIYHLRD